MAEHVIAHSELTATISGEMASEWEDQIMAWENDTSKENPYVSRHKGRFIQSAMYHLADNSHQVQLRLRSARSLLMMKLRPLPEAMTSPLTKRYRRWYSSQVDWNWKWNSKCMGKYCFVDTDSLTRRLVARLEKNLWQHARDRQMTQFQLRSNALERGIIAWQRFQDLYCPLVEDQREKDRDVSKPHTEPLYLPSALVRLNIAFDQIHGENEFLLWYGQACEALDSLRGHLQMRAYLYKFKDRFIRGQAANTKARNAINLAQDRINVAVADYRSAQEALTSLANYAPTSLEKWSEDLRKLEDDDVRDLSEGRSGESEGRRTISWIWKTGVLNNGDETDQDKEVLVDRTFFPFFIFQHTGSDTHLGVRIEWCKSRARAKRFTEEVMLLLTEMERVCSFLAWKAEDWRQKGSITSPWTFSPDRGYNPTVREEGLRAYAFRQADLYYRLKGHFEVIWSDVPAHLTRMGKIIETPSLALPGELEGKLPRSFKGVKRRLERT